MKTSPFLVIWFGAALLIPVGLEAGARTSASYTITTDVADSGGQRTSSASYTNDGSAGGVVGTSTVVAPSEIAKHGYIGQLYEVTGLSLNAAALNVNETATVQLAAWQVLDDASLLAVPAASVAWNVVSGPLSGINAGGLATVGVVYQTTGATVQGTFLGDTGTLGLTVLNASLDNFGAYAGDAIDDAWQVQYFGQPPNADAGPNADVSGTGQSNLFKFVAGLNPLDPNSRFSLAIAAVPGQPGQKNLVFSPRFADRTYVIMAKPVLDTGSYVPLTNPSAPNDAGQQRTVTDLSAGSGTKFYRVEITKP